VTVTTSSESTADVAVRPAATVMLLADRPELEVLMLRRRHSSRFVGGMSLFPGGGVDAQDAHPALAARCAALSERDASRCLGLAQGGLAYWVAGVRETFEEAGVLLARDPRTGRSLDLSDAELARRFAAHRRALDAGTLSLEAILRSEGLALSLESMCYAARWITPPGPVRRYDTRFFVAPMPAGQVPEHDGGEAERAEWLRPADALARFAEGRLRMLPPTVGMLRILAGFARSGEALAAAAAAQAGPDYPARLAGSREAWRVLLPGDPDDAAEAVFPLQAWVRLRAPGPPPPAGPGRELAGE
jgi:8-oxo-dGTP pyrophosphatase MutT (NUDIX family)